MDALPYSNCVGKRTSKAVCNIILNTPSCTRTNTVFYPLKLRARHYEAFSYSPENPGVVLPRLPGRPSAGIIAISAVRKQVIHPISARLVVTFPPAWMVTVCVIYRCGWVNLVTLHANLSIYSRLLLLYVAVVMVVVMVVVVVVKVDIIVHVVAQVEEQIGTPDVFINISTHSPL